MFVLQNIFMIWFKQDRSNVLLNIYVVPRSSKTETVGEYDGYLKIKLKSPPVDNAANEELIRFLADKLKVSKKSIKILRGLSQKRKTLCIKDSNLDKIQELMTC